MSAPGQGDSPAGRSSLRIGLTIGPERGRSATKIERIREDARWAEQAGLSSIWIPQLPNDLDALTAAALAGSATTSIEVGTAVVPVQLRHPLALAQQALSVQAVCAGRLTLGLGLSHHWVIEAMAGVPYDRPLRTMICTLDVLDAALSGPGPVDVENELFRVHARLDVTDLAPTPVVLAALGPRMLELAGQRAEGTVLWMADERAVESHVVPTITRAAAAAGRPAPRVIAEVPVCLCTDGEVADVIDHTNRHLAEAEISPNYQRLLSYGEARRSGDILAAGPEQAIERRLRRFADAGATEVAALIVPGAGDRAARRASVGRTRELLASLAGSL